MSGDPRPYPSAALVNGAGVNQRYLEVDAGVNPKTKGKNPTIVLDTTVGSPIDLTGAVPATPAAPLPPVLRNSF